MTHWNIGKSFNLSNWKILKKWQKLQKLDNWVSHIVTLGISHWQIGKLLNWQMEKG